MIKIPFNALPDATRERFVLMSKGVSHKAIYAKTTHRLLPYTFWTVVIAAFGGWLWVSAQEAFGSAWYRIRWEYQGMFIACWMMIAWAVLSILRRALLDLRCPYRRGVYLLATTLVDATSDVLVIRSLAKVSLSVQINTNKGRYTSTTVNFRFPDGFTEYFIFSRKTRAREVADHFKAARSLFRSALNGNDLERIRDQDLFFEAGQEGMFQNPDFAKRRPATQGPHLAKRTPGSALSVFVAAIAAGLVIGVPFVVVRDYISQRIGVQRAIQEDNIRNLRTWARSVYYGDFIATEILPEAEVRAAERQAEDLRQRSQPLQDPSSQSVIEVYPIGTSPVPQQDAAPGSPR